MDVKSLLSSLKEARARSARLRKRRRAEAPGRAFFSNCLFVWTPCILVTTFLLAVVVRHWRRSADLQPLLNAIADDVACTHKQTTTCALKLTGDESNRFDLHPAENPLLGFIWEQVVSKSLPEMREVLSGAHVILADPQGTSYTFLQSLPGAVRRGSSTHRSDRAQYDIPEGHVVSSVLIGYLNNATWFQLEGAPWDLEHHFWSSLGHIFDTTEYALTFMTNNVGPLGTSRYTDKRPLRKESVVPISKACPAVCDGRPGQVVQLVAPLAPLVTDAPSLRKKQHALQLTPHKRVAIPKKRPNLNTPGPTPKRADARNAKSNLFRYTPRHFV